MTTLGFCLSMPLDKLMQIIHSNTNKRMYKEVTLLFPVAFFSKIKKKNVYMEIENVSMYIFGASVGVIFNCSL